MVNRIRKSFGVHPYFTIDRLPGQVPPRRLPARLDPELEIELKQSKPWSVADLLAHNEPRYRAATVVRDLGLDTRTEEQWAARIQREATSAPNELVYRRNLIAGLHETTFGPELRRVFMQRAGAFYRTLHKGPRLTLGGPDVLEKGTAYPAGTERHWRDGRTYRKGGDGKWRPVAEPGHAGIEDMYAEGAHIIARGKALEVISHHGDKIKVRDEASGREGELTIAALKGLGAQSAPERAEHVRKKRAAQAKPRSAGDQGERRDPRLLVPDGERTPAGERDDGAHGEGARPEAKPVEVTPPAPTPEPTPPAPEPVAAPVEPPKPPKEKKPRAPRARKEAAAKEAVEAVPRVPAAEIKPDPEPRVWKPAPSPAITKHAEYLPEITRRLPEDIKVFSNPTDRFTQLISHQVEGAERILTAWEKGDGFVLMDDAGLGKTNTAIAAMKAHGGKRNLIIVPPAGKVNLKRQWKEDAGEPQGVTILDAKHAAPDRDGTFILSYDEILEDHIDENGKQVYNLVPGKRGKLKQVKAKRIKPSLAGQWDSILFDESHTMQEDGERANAAIDLQTQASKALYMSATPFTNISNMHYLTKLGMFSKRSEFVEWARMAGATVKDNVVENPSSHVPMTVIAATLHVDGKSLKRETSLEGVKSEFGVVRKDELTKDERRTFNAIHYLFDEAAKLPDVIMPGYAEMARPSWARQFWEVSKARRAIELGKQAIAEGKQVAFYTSFKEANHAHVRALIRLAYNSESYWMSRTDAQGRPAPDMAKAIKCSEFAKKVEKMLSKLPKLKPVVEQLTEAFGGPDEVAEIHGATKKDPGDEQKAYQEGRKKVVVATMARGGTGISLHDDRGIAPRVQINLSLPWSGREFNQVAGRSHRLGSKSNTVMHWLVGDDGTEQSNGARVAKRLKSMGSLSAGDPDQTVDASALEAWEWGTADEGAASDDPEEIAAAAEKAQKRAERLEENAADSARARQAFRDFAEQRASGRDVIGERYQERLKEQAKARELEHRRAAEQLKTLGLQISHDRETGEFRVGGERVGDLMTSKAGWGRSLNRYTLERGLTGDQLVKLAQKLDVHKVKIDMGQVAREAAAKEKAEREARELHEAAEKVRLASMTPLERHADALGKIQINRKPHKRLTARIVTLDRFSPAVKYGRAKAGDQGVRITGGTFDIKETLRDHGGRGDRDRTGLYYYDVPADEVEGLVNVLQKDVRHDMAKSIRYAIPRLEPLPDFIGEILWNSQTWGLTKGAGHKYIRRIDTGRPGKRRYRYFYTVTGGEHLAHDSELTEGSSFKLKDGGKEGHFHILSKDPETGEITVRHDESGAVHKLSGEAFRAMLHAHHAEAIETKRTKLRSQLAEVAQYGSEKQKARVQARADKFQATFGGVHPPKPNAPEVPKSVRENVARELKVLTEAAETLRRARYMSGDGRHEAIVWGDEGLGAKVAEANAKLDSFVEAAKKKGLDVEAFFAEMGGRPNPELTAGGKDYLAEQTKRASKPPPAAPVIGTKGRMINDPNMKSRTIGLDMNVRVPSGEDTVTLPVEIDVIRMGEKYQPEHIRADVYVGGELMIEGASVGDSPVAGIASKIRDAISAGIRGRLPATKQKDITHKLATAIQGAVVEHRNGVTSRTGTSTNLDAHPQKPTSKPPPKVLSDEELDAALARHAKQKGQAASKDSPEIPEGSFQRFDALMDSGPVGGGEAQAKPEGHDEALDFLSSLPDAPPLEADPTVQATPEPEAAKPEGHDDALAFLDALPDAPPLEAEDAKPAGADLRETAAGKLGAKLNELEREGWEVVAAPPDARMSQQAILGRLPGGKVKQLLEAGITLQRKEGAGPVPEPAKPAVERFVIPHGQDAAKRVTEQVPEDVQRFAADWKMDAKVLHRLVGMAENRPDRLIGLAQEIAPNNPGLYVDKAKALLRERKNADPEASVARLVAYGEKVKQLGKDGEALIGRAIRLVGQYGKSRGKKQYKWGDSRENAFLGEHGKHYGRVDVLQEYERIKDQHEYQGDALAAAVANLKGIKVPPNIHLRTEADQTKERAKPSKLGQSEIPVGVSHVAWETAKNMVGAERDPEKLKAWFAKYKEASGKDQAHMRSTVGGFGGRNDDDARKALEQLHRHLGLGELHPPPPPRPEPKPVAPKPEPVESDWAKDYKAKDAAKQKKVSETHTAQHDVEGLASKIRAAGYDVRWHEGVGGASDMEIVQVSGKGAGKTLNTASFRADGSVQVYTTKHKTTTNLVADHLRSVHGEIERVGYSGRMTPKPGAVKPEPKPAQATETPGSTARLLEGKHTKYGHDIWTVQIGKRVERHEYDAINAKAKALGGYYSSFKGRGATPGFVFKDAAKAKQFHAHLNGREGGGQAGASPAPASDDERHGAHEPVETEIRAKRGKSASARLREVADSVRERATERMNADRKRNTARRARMAAGVDEDSRREIAHAETMHRIADGLEDGSIKHLKNVSAKTHVEALHNILNRGKYKRIQKQPEMRYGDREAAYHEPPTAEDADHALYPYPSVHKDWISRIEGPIAKDPAVKRMKKEAERIGDGYQIELKTPELREAAERTQKLLQVNGEAYGAKQIGESLKEFRRIHDDLGIQTLPQLKDALREYASVREAPKKESAVAKMQRELVGRKFAGYFPTPRPIVDKMLEAADVGEGHSVLEPSAGQGHIADAVRDHGGKVTTLEAQPEMQKILEAKGHTIAGHDALDHHEKYDRVVMNPPFEHGQDAQHVMHAFEHNLKPGGRMVAIMGEHPFFANDWQSQAFRSWLDSKGGQHEKLPPGSFKSSDRPTGVNTRMVVIEKLHHDMGKSLRFVIPRGLRFSA